MNIPKTCVVLLALMLAAMAIVPCVSALDDGTGQAFQEKSIQTVQHSMNIDSSAPQMSQEEFRNYVQEMSAKYGSENVKALRSMSGEPDTIQGITYVGAWTDHLSNTAASADCALILYKFNQADSSGRDHYYYWQWTSAQPNAWWDLTNFWNKNQLTNGNSRVITYSPGSTITGNGVTVNVGLSAGYGGMGFTIGGPFTLMQNTVRPKPGECSTGYGGKYTVEWTGLYSNPQEIKGAMHVDIPQGQSLTSTWTNSVSGL